MVEGIDEGLPKSEGLDPKDEARWLPENWIDAVGDGRDCGQLDPLERR